jgi:hypothetical protein
MTDTPTVDPAVAALQQQLAGAQAALEAERQGRQADREAAGLADRRQKDAMAAQAHVHAEAKKGAAKLVAAAQAFLAATAGLPGDKLGLDAAGKSRLQQHRNAVAEALNDMQAGG